MTNTNPIPVTVLTGFLGSGKTTLLNYILQANHGKKIAVIENEYGEVGVDNDLVLGAEEEIFEMNNGCICCTVRGDLIRILGQLTKRKDKLDYILLETTGLANPAPVAQTFWVDDEMRSNYKLDAIVTLVDAKHVWNHIDTSEECLQQLAFADVLLINKTDLVTQSELDALKKRLRKINSQAKVIEANQARVNLDDILHIGAFDVDAKLKIYPEFAIEEYPYEALQIYYVQQGEHTWHIDMHHHDALHHQHEQHHHEEHHQEHHHHHHPDSIDMAIFSVQVLDDAALQTIKKKGIVAFSEKANVKKSGALIPTSGSLQRLDLKGEEKHLFKTNFQKPGSYAVFFSVDPAYAHLKLMRNGQLVKPSAKHFFEHSHSHEDQVSSVGIELKGEMDEYKLNDWLGYLLQNHGQDIYRMKGVVAVEGEVCKVVFQGVHMILDVRPGAKWSPSEERINKMVFIGKNLDRDYLTKEFRSCILK